MPPWYQLVPIQFEPTSKLPYWKLQYPTHVKDIDHDAHIRVFKKLIIANGETMEANIINLFGFTLQENTSKWGENFVQDHFNYTFDQLEQKFCNFLWIVKIDEEVYMQLKNLQQQVGKRIKVYYEHSLKLVDCL
jgi:hypothetical protein